MQLRKYKKQYSLFSENSNNNGDLKISKEFVDVKKYEKLCDFVEKKKRR